MYHTPILLIATFQNTMNQFLFLSLIGRDCRDFRQTTVHIPADALEYVKGPDSH